MAKKILEKITTRHNFKIEGILNIDSLDDNLILVDVEDIGEVCLKKIALNKFNGKYIKITVDEIEEEIPELEI